MDWAKAIEDIEYVKGLADEMGGADRVQRQHDGGRYTVRERMEKFCDPGSFLEMGHLIGAAEYDSEGNLVEFSPGGYVMGLGEISGRPVSVGGDDFTLSGGSPHDVHKLPHHFAQPLALKYGIPYVQLREGVGHSSKQDEQDGHMGLPQGDLWHEGVELLRNVPVASAILGSVAGWPAAAALLSHFSVMIKDKSQIFPSGPPVVSAPLERSFPKKSSADGGCM